MNNADRDLPISFNGATGGANGITNQTKMAIAGTFTKINMKLPFNLTQGSLTVTLDKNGVATALTCTFSTGSSSCINTANPISVVAGDLVSFTIHPASTPLPTPANSLFAGISFDGTTSGESIVTGNVRTPASAITQYGPLGYIENSNLTSEIATTVIFPTSGTLDLMTIQTANPPGVGTSWAISLRQGTTQASMATTTLTCTISGAVSQTCNDSTHSITIAAGDRLSMVALGAGTPLTNQNGIVSMRFKPTIDGESVMMSRFGSGQSASLSTYAFTGGNQGNTTDEASSTATTPVGFTWKKLYVDVDTAPGSTRSRQYTARINGSGASLTCQIANTATSCNDTSNSASVSAEDKVVWQNTPTNNPTGSTNVRISGVMFIQPSVVSNGIAKVIINGAKVIFNNGLWKIL